MRWNHGHSWIAGIVTGIVISQHSILLIILGAVIVIVFNKLGTLYRLVMANLGRRWAIRP